jgi:hypothetical protein
MTTVKIRAARTVAILLIALAFVAGCTQPGSSGSAGSAATPAPASAAPSSDGGYSY